jgi:pimeloyl-ACP methyl ester carboxylesterase
VPFLAIPPSGDPATAPIVIAWHLMDAPRTEAAFAAAVPLAGLDAWKLYLGLPEFGARMAAGGPEELFGKLAIDAPGLVHGPIHAQAADEFPEAFGDLRQRLGLGTDAPVGLVGGSMGAAVASEVLARGTSGARAAVLISPLLELRSMIDAVAPEFGGYEWTEAGTAGATRLDYVTRAGELAASGAAIRIIVGADDLPAMVDAAVRLGDALSADLHIMTDMAHALAEEPGIEPAPQSEDAKRVDPLAAEWLRTHLA